MNIEEILKAGRKVAKKVEEDKLDQVLITFQIPRKLRTAVMEKVRKNHMDLSEYLRQCCQTLLDHPMGDAKSMRSANRRKISEMAEAETDASEIE